MLTAMSLNLNYYGDKHGAWPRRRELIREAIGQAAPDVLMLQAVCSAPATERGLDQALQLCRLLPDRWYIFFEPAKLYPDGRREGSAIMAKFPFKERHVCKLSLRPGLEDANPRVIQHARLELPRSDSIHLFNAHFSWVPVQTADNLAEGIPFCECVSGPTLVMGDFNTPADSPLLEQLRAAGFTDLWMALRGDEGGATFEADKPSLRIDYAWANAALAPHACGIEVVRNSRDDEGVRLSDHLGLKATFDIG